MIHFPNQLSRHSRLAFVVHVSVCIFLVVPSARPQDGPGTYIHETLARPGEPSAAAYSLPCHYWCLPEQALPNPKLLAIQPTNSTLEATAPPGCEFGAAKTQSIRRGEAEYRLASGAWTPLAIRDILPPGTSVRTDLDCIVDFFLRSNGPVIRLTPGSELEFTTLLRSQSEGETVIDTTLTLRRGRLLGAVKKLAAASKYEIITPVITVAIRGTQFDVSADGRVTLINGTAIVLYRKLSQAFVVNAGQTFTLGAGQGELTEDLGAKETIRPKRLFGD